MVRIDVVESGMGEHVDWMLSRPQMAMGMGALSEAVYGHSRLPVREREAARYTIALINDCKVCRATRAKPAAEARVGEGQIGEMQVGQAQGQPTALPAVEEAMYAAITDWRASVSLTDRERLAAEYAERFALDHLAMDDAFWARLRANFRDDEITDLTISCGMWLGMGRALAVMGVSAPPDRLLV